MHRLDRASKEEEEQKKTKPLKKPKLPMIKLLSESRWMCNDLAVDQGRSQGFVLGGGLVRAKRAKRGSGAEWTMGHLFVTHDPSDPLHA